ncbi:MAG: hypothetical protein DSM106950_27030 [Stigonema ocellatum SAG 48.90 = DSM 106950]|nr:hypothetical protein [Stigonema ocellatum SAG 48.90 = DSM 106950]
MPLIGKKIRIASTLFLLLSGVPLWLVTEAMTAKIVQAYTTRVDLAIDGLPGDNYESLVQRAEAAARAAAQRSFDQDILVTDVSIIVSVQNYGAIAPVLELAVSRQQWRTRPDPQRWATYFKTARSLLFFQQNFTPPTSTSPQPLTPLPKEPQQPINLPPSPLPKLFTPPK